ncbi:MAG: hypothetical protein U1F66_06905 [bacterium]
MPATRSDQCPVHHSARKAIVFALLASVFISLAQFYFKVGSGGVLPGQPASILAQPQVWWGVLFYLVSLYWTMKAYQWGDLSFVLPIVCLCDVWNVLLGYFALGEALTVTRLAGTGIILLGILVLTR